jgi:hypothetical protein
MHPDGVQYPLLLCGVFCARAAQTTNTQLGRRKLIQEQRQSRSRCWNAFGICGGPAQSDLYFSFRSAETDPAV